MPLCPAGSLVWASDPARPDEFSPATWAKLDPAPKKRVKSLVFCVFILWFFLCVCVCIYMCLKKYFSCVLHTANTLTCFECFFLKQIFQVLKENLF
jgi:presenilin-like A22 family membrane protease